MNCIDRFLSSLKFDKILDLAPIITGSSGLVKKLSVVSLVCAPVNKMTHK